MNSSKVWHYSTQLLVLIRSLIDSLKTKLGSINSQQGVAGKLEVPPLETLSDEQSLGDEATGHLQDFHLSDEQSLGDEITLAGEQRDHDPELDDYEHLTSIEFNAVDFDARYQIEKIVEESNQHQVSIATDSRLGRKVIVRKYYAEGSGKRADLNAFLADACAAAAINNPHVVQILDYGDLNQYRYLITECLPDGTLFDRCVQKPLATDEVLRIAHELCEGLGEAHRLRVLHRQISPRRIYFSSGGLVKLGDFGLPGSNANPKKNRSNQMHLADFDYVAPELRQGDQNCDIRSDIWSLAASIYFMFTGTSPRLFNADLLPREFQDLLQKSLHVQPEQRYQSIAELDEALRLVEQGDRRHGETLQPGECFDCGIVNHAGRTFCRACASPLTVSCLNCTHVNTLWEDVCAECGSRQSVLIDQRNLQLQQRQEKASTLLGSHRYEEASAEAQQIINECDIWTQNTKRWAEAFLDRVETTKEFETNRADSCLRDALQLEEAKEYRSASKRIGQIPMQLRTVPSRVDQIVPETALQRIERKITQIKQLKSSIKDAFSSKNTHTILPWVVELIELLGEKRELLRLRDYAEGRRDRFNRKIDRAISKAKQHYESQNYQATIAFLGQIPPELIDSEIEELQDRANAALHRSRALRQAMDQALQAKAYEGLIEVVQEYLKLRANDSDAKQLLNMLLAREQGMGLERQRLAEKAEALKLNAAYDSAAIVLETVPQRQRDASFQQLIDRYQFLYSLRIKSLEEIRSIIKKKQFSKIPQSVPRYLNFLKSNREIADSQFSEMYKTYRKHLADFKANLEAEARYQAAKKRRRIVLVVLLILSVPVGIGAREAYYWRKAEIANAMDSNNWLRVLELDPFNSVARMEQALLDLNEKNKTPIEVLTILETIERQAPDTDGISDAITVTIAIQASASAANNKTHLAATQLQEALERGLSDERELRVKEDIAAAYAEKARLALEDGDQTGAIVAGMNALEWSPDIALPRSIAEYAKSSIQEKRIAEAKRVTEIALSAYQKSRNEETRRTVIHCIDQLRQLDPDSPYIATYQKRIE